LGCLLAWTLVLAPCFFLILLSLAEFHHLFGKTFLCHELFWLSLQNIAGFIFTETESKIMPTHALLLVENASQRIQQHT
jgi:hypothetical protein